MSTTDDAEGGFNVSVFEAGMRAQRALNAAQADPAAPVAATVTYLDESGTPIKTKYTTITPGATPGIMELVENITRRVSEMFTGPIAKIRRRVAAVARRAIAEIKARLRAVMNAAAAHTRTWDVFVMRGITDLLNAAYVALVRGAAGRPERVTPMPLLDVHNAVSAPRPGPVAGTVPAAA